MKEALLAGRKRKLNREVVKSIGQHLAAARRERGLTQVELARELGITQSHLSQYELGALRLHGETVVQIARILRVSADDILGIKSTKSNGATKNRRLARRLQQLDQLPVRDQQAVLRMIDALVLRRSLETRPPHPRG